MAEAKGKRGCLGRFVMYIAIFLILSVAVTIIAYRRVGGAEGLKHWLVNQTLSSIENKILRDIENIPKEEPYGISEDEIKNTFQQIKDANSADNINQVQLYQVLETYQEAFRNSTPAADDIQTFLEQLRSTIELSPE